MEDPGPDEEDLVRPGRPCGGEVASEHLAPEGCATITRDGDGLDLVLTEVCGHRVDQVDMLDCGDKANPAALKQRQGPGEHGHVEVYPDRLVYDIRALLDRCMSEVDQDVGMHKGIERKVTGPVAGIATDDHIKPSIAERGRHPRRPPRKSGRELEGNALCAAFPEPSDKIRYRYQ